MDEMRGSFTTQATVILNLIQDQLACNRLCSCTKIAGQARNDGIMFVALLLLEARAAIY
jgi:hypothetical protein